MATYTLNNIVDLIEAFRSSHLQLKSFYFGRLPDSTSEQDIEFPTLLAELQPSPISENGGNGEETFVFKFYVLDRADHNRANEKDTLSDCKLIANDLVAYFKLTSFTNNLTINVNLTMNPLIGALDDLCNGWEFDVFFKQPLNLNKCSIPITI